MNIKQPVEKVTPKFRLWLLIFNIIAALLIFLVLVILRLPILINADYFLTYDEAHQALQILNLQEGGPVSFYYDGERYAGIFLGLTAIPFFWLLGVGALAYKLPGTLAYALYVLSTYWIAKKIQPSAALITVLLVIFSSPAILFISSNNWQHNLIIFLGNIIFLCFFKIKESEVSGTGPVLLLGFVMGFAIYSYTYSILYIATIAILYVLSWKHWEVVRNTFSVRKIRARFQDSQSKKRKLVMVLDGVIFVFFAAIIFSYVFGGFGIDIAGHSILQINKLHKPVGQLLVLIIVRVLIFNKDIKSKINWFKNLFVTSNAFLGRLIVIGCFGFLIGISPRIASILTGETKKGGQGFDVDLIPTNIIAYLWKLVFYDLPEFLGVRVPLISIFRSDLTLLNLINGALAAGVAVLIVTSFVFFFRSRWQEIRKIVRLKRLTFEPSLVFAVFPILICAAVLILKNGPDVRYLLPLHGVVAVFGALYLDSLRPAHNKKFTVFLAIWLGFGIVNTYYFYTNTASTYSLYYATADTYNAKKDGIVKDLSIIRMSSPYDGIIKFCQEKGISSAYSDYETAGMITFLTQKNVKVGDYSNNDGAERINRMLVKEKDFAIIIPSLQEKELSSYQEFLEKTGIEYVREKVEGGFLVFRDFRGKPDEINLLRSLM
ncbi:MAG: glycosyltransferase family 39 protein [Nitrospinae bacterium]|nr:glycosyltransferase family 39 protein [Nitrospinota bacterium]